MAENEEKIFEYYLMLPTNVRTKAIDKMKPDDRCRLTRCSKQCRKEAIASKNYIYQLSFAAHSTNSMAISVHYEKHASFFTEMSGYNLGFTKESNGKKYKNYRDQSGRRWEIELDRSTNIGELAIADFKCLLQTHQNTVKSLHLFDREDRVGVLINVDLEIDGLDNLETLSVFSNYDIRILFSKLRRPLKELMVFEENNFAFLAGCEQLYQVQEKLIAFGAKLNLQQHLRLSASNIRIHIGELTERDVFKIIRSWQNGTFPKKIKNLHWNLRDSNFDIRKLLRLLRVGYDFFGRTIEIKHFGDSGKIAILSTLHERLYFGTGDNHVW